MSGFYENISTEVSVEADVADAEAAKTAAEAAQTAAESARDTALQHKNAAEVAKNAAETAETNAESAESTATTAKSSAEAARDLAETYKNAAETAKTAAETAETNATNTVASVSSDVATVAAIDSEITSVAGSLSSVNTVAGDLSGSNNIGTVAGIDTEIGTVAGISSDVTAVAGDATDIGTVATDLAGSDTIGTVSSNIANVNTVAGISSDITAVAGDAADIGTVASNLTGDNTIGSVSSSISNVNTVANNMADVNSVADNMTDVSNAATNAGNAASSATAAAASATSASTSATNAASSESAASTSASSAASNAASASTSATQASTSATQASSSADLASSSATAAASSATAAATSESNAEDSQQAAAASESNASGSASSALSSATSATSSASSAASSASSAAASAASASNIIADLVDLDSAVSNASSSASSASTSASQAQSYRDEAETHKDNAYTYSQSAASAVAYQDLTAIAESKSVTAKDVFVYDTTKDSDGGAWRNTTQHTSWYNETLNTSTRGATKKFPAVAVIVAQSGTVTIYDGDDPALPMWMVFNSAATSNTRFLTFGSNGGTLKSVAAQNGVLSVGRSSTGTANQSFNGLTIVNFVADAAQRIGQFGTNEGVFSGGVSTRNSASLGAATSQRLVENHVNDVAMTVLPDAPIDDATGLPTPTIAVATDGGVSIIKDDGTVVDIRNGDNVNHARSVTFTSDNKIACQLYDQQRGIRIFDIPDADVTQGNHYIKSNALEWYEGVSNEGSASDGDLDIYTINLGNTNVNIAHSLNPIDINKTLYLSKPNGLAAVHRNPSSPSSGAVALVASDHTTGWMVGDIKGAFLSDTDDTNMVGSELVDNGDFATTSDWSLQSGVSISGGVLSSDGTSTGELARQSDIGVANGSIYAISFDVISLTAGKFGVKLGGTTPVYFDTTGSHEAHFVATATDNVQIMGLSGTTGSVDNVSVKPAVPDRSFNKNALIVNGTINRSAVATGAELVGYSGFSASNYLEQPYNSDLDFGTGDFCITVWAKQNGTSTRYIVDTRNNAGAGVFLVAGSSYQLALNAGNSVTGGTAGTGNWTHVTGLRRSGTLELYVNGELVSSTANTYAASNPSGRLTVGVRGGLLTGPYLGSLALLRISATAPSAEQIKKIYNDERHLFKENANCTLYGTSDDVNALAYDEDTGLLHVGTSGGRSVFKGLQRVDNTTDAVGVAISASNDLVVEE